MLESKIYAKITYISTIIFYHSFSISKNKKIHFYLDRNLMSVTEFLLLFTFKICTIMAINHTTVKRISIANAFPIIRGSAK
jgi:hypothetical protein